MKKLLKTCFKILLPILMALPLAIVFILWPKHLTDVDHRGIFFQGLQIKQHKSSPAFAALEDSRKDYLTIEFETEQNPLERIKAGEESAVSIISPIVDGLKKLETAAQDEWPLLEGMVISSAQAIVIRQPRTEKGLIAFNSEVSKEDPISINSPTIDIAVERAEYETGIENKKEFLAAHISEEWIKRESFEKRAQALVEKALAERETQKVSGRKMIATESGGQIIVARPSSSPPHQASSPKVGGKSTMAEVPKVEQPSWSLAQKGFEKRTRPYSLKGHVQLVDGLAFLGGGSYIRVYRSLGAEIIEISQVKLPQGEFDIFVDELRGDLVAELISEEGELIGKGTLDLYSVTLPASHEVAVRNLKVSIHPTSSNIEVTVVSAHSYENATIPVEKAELYFDRLNQPFHKSSTGTFISSDVERSSSYVLRATAPGHWDTLAISNGQEQQQVRLYPNKMIEAFLDLSRSAPTYKTPSPAIVWGRALAKGKPQAGIEIEIGGGLYDVIYFNQFNLPDRKLTATSNNGIYAVIADSSGLLSVRAKYKNRVYPAQVVPLEPGSVSTANFSFATQSVGQVSVYDGLDTSRPIKGTVSLFGTDSDLELTGRAEILFPLSSSQLLLESEAGEAYEYSRIWVSRYLKSFRVPSVRSDWLESVEIEKRINRDLDSGIVIGFVENDAFTIQLNEQKGHLLRDNLVYFDAYGRVIRESYGVAGGGFIIFNVPSGIHTLALDTGASNKLQSRSVLSEPGIVQILSFN